jgi:hypothetical protein
MKIIDAAKNRKAVSAFNFGSRVDCGETRGKALFGILASVAVISRSQLADRVVDFGFRRSIRESKNLRKWVLAGFSRKKNAMVDSAIKATQKPQYLSILGIVRNIILLFRYQSNTG